MKRLILMTLMSLGALAFAGSASAGISTTPHNLGSGDTNTQICIYCHTPHNASTTVAAPLWNRVDTTATYSMYTSATLDMTIAGTPQGVSLACLSCHDGALAYNQLINVGNASNTDKMTGDHKVGPDLTNDHPISVTYDTTKDTAFNAAVSGKVGGTLPLFGSSKDQVECATCHSVHDNSRGDFRRIANTGSALCLTCHIK